jgi:hypothetical protein
VGNILAKVAFLRINLNIDGAPIASKSHWNGVFLLFFVPCSLYSVPVFHWFHVPSSCVLVCIFNHWVFISYRSSHTHSPITLANLSSINLVSEGKSGPMRCNHDPGPSVPRSSA